MKSRVLAESRCHRRGVHRIVASPEEPSEAFGDADMAEVKEAAERMRLELPFDCRRLTNTKESMRSIRHDCFRAA